MTRARPAALIGAWMLAALVLMSCGDSDTDYSDDPPAANGPPSVAREVPAVDLEDLVWIRVDLDEALIGDLRIIRSVIATDTGFVAVGAQVVDGDLDAMVWTSADATRWARVAHDEHVFGGPGNQEMWAVTVGGPGLVAVGYDDSEGTSSYSAESDAAVWVSVDGTDWSRVAHDEAIFGDPDERDSEASQSMSSVTSTASGLIAAGYETLTGPAVWTSHDGLEWSRVRRNTSGTGSSDEVAGGVFDRINAVTRGGPGLVAVGSSEADAAVWVSVDGTDWSRIAHDEAIFGDIEDLVGFGGNQEMLSVAATTFGLAAVGIEGSNAAVWTSADGLDWTRVAHDEALFGDFQEMSAVASIEPGVIAVGNSRDGPTVWMSADGIDWTRTALDQDALDDPPSARMRSVAAGQLRVVAVGGDDDAAVWYATIPD